VTSLGRNRVRVVVDGEQRLDGPFAAGSRIVQQADELIR
jgi:hypothetical protein